MPRAGAAATGTGSVPVTQFIQVIQIFTAAAGSSAPLVLGASTTGTARGTATGSATAAVAVTVPGPVPVPLAEFDSESLRLAQTTANAGPPFLTIAASIASKAAAALAAL